MSRRSVLLGAAFSLGLALVLPAERIWVANLGDNTVVFFDSETNALEGSVTVGNGPIDMAADPATQRLFVVNSLDDTLSVVSLNPVGAVGTLVSDVLFGAYDVPSGVTRTSAGQILVVDQKATVDPIAGAGRSTIRAIDPLTLQTVDGFRDPSPTARFSDVVTTANGRIWVADAGDGGVTVVFPPSPAAPWGFPRTLIYQGGGEFADFIEDKASEQAVPPVPKTFLVQPRRLATNGTTRVVAADAGSDVVTILDANYVAESLAVLQNVDLGLAPGQTVDDVLVHGDFAYAVSGAVSTLFRIHLGTFVLDSLPLGGLMPSGLGVTSDGRTLFVGGTGAAADIQAVDLDPAGGPPALGALLTGVAGHTPFAFVASAGGTMADPGSTPLLWVGTTTGSSSKSNDCGLLGAEALLLLWGAAALVRRRP